MDATGASMTRSEGMRHEGIAETHGDLGPHSDSDFDLA